MKCCNCGKEIRCDDPYFTHSRGIMCLSCHKEEDKKWTEYWKNKWPGWYWVKWGIVLGLKSILYGVFIWAGPVQLVFNRAYLVDDTQIGGACICVIFAIFGIVDLIAMLLFPWIGGGRDLPVGLGYGKPWRKYRDRLKRGMYV